MLSSMPITRIALLACALGIPMAASIPQAPRAHQTAPPPEQLPTYVANDPLKFPSGTKYAYSNTDNILVGLMVAAVDGTSYEQSLEARVYTPFGLTGTNLPVGAHLLH